MTNFYQVVDHIDDKATYVHQTGKAAISEAKERGFHVGSELSVIGIWLQRFNTF